MKFTYRDLRKKKATDICAHAPVKVYPVRWFKQKRIYFRLLEIFCFLLLYFFFHFFLSLNFISVVLYWIPLHRLEMGQFQYCF